jgi:hypothetical protein
MKRILVLALIALGVIGLVALARRSDDRAEAAWTPVDPS